MELGFRLGLGFQFWWLILTIVIPLPTELLIELRFTLVKGALQIKQRDLPSGPNGLVAYPLGAILLRNAYTPRASRLLTTCLQLLG